MLNRKCGFNIMLVCFLASVLYSSCLSAGAKAPAKAASSNSMYEKRNLGPNINTVYDEILPVISPDGKTLYYCRRWHPENVGEEKKEDIWYSRLNPDGSWAKSVNIGPPLNNEYGNAVCSVTPDGNTLLLAGDYADGSELKHGLLLSNRTKTGWSQPALISIKNFYYNNQYISYCLTNDGSKLIIGMERNDSYGGLDIYVSFRETETEWSEPMNLGPRINTPEDETSPFLAADGSTMYFSSKGHSGFGDYDVYLSRLQDDTWKNWSEPENLGENVNTPLGDANYMIPAEGDYAYFSSKTESIGGWDIFRILMPKEARPKPVVMVSGIVSNKMTKEPVGSSITYQTFPEGENFGWARSNPSNGEFKIALPAGSVYRILVDADGFVTSAKNVDLSKIEKFSEITENFELNPADSLIDVVRKLDFNDLNELSKVPDYLDILPQDVLQKEIFDKFTIYFDFGKFPLDAKFYPGLGYIVNIMKKYPAFRLSIVGNTDSIGRPENNLKLSEKRAKAVAEYLTKNGIAKKRISTKGMGQTNPIATNETEEGRGKNRRVVFYVLKK